MSCGVVWVLDSKPRSYAEDEDLEDDINRGRRRGSRDVSKLEIRMKDRPVCSSSSRERTSRLSRYPLSYEILQSIQY